jgi:hydrogenase maturation protease
MKTPDTMILGIGNLLCRDDGIGVITIMEMRGQDKYEGVLLVDGGTNPDLTSLLDDHVDRLIIVDALRGGGNPGDIYRLYLREENMADGIPASSHGMGIIDSLKLMRQLGQRTPKVTVIGIEPADISHGLHLSPVIEAKLADIIRTVDNEIERPD